MYIYGYTGLATQNTGFKNYHYTADADGNNDDNLQIGRSGARLEHGWINGQQVVLPPATAILRLFSMIPLFLPEEGLERSRKLVASRASLYAGAYGAFFSLFPFFTTYTFGPMLRITGIGPDPPVLQIPSNVALPRIRQCDSNGFEDLESGVWISGSLHNTTIGVGRVHPTKTSGYTMTTTPPPPPPPRITVDRQEVDAKGNRFIMVTEAIR
ncbi:uncharacterized protein B0T15DRAFT_509831 [Chaetomium strumarium]|uniref:Uncharacterized protein n=1 Tax=Chaetomium strumarium TaxID=1170767 RepID=A0AAJ0GUN2_9PEZI|nr:hypothetical protein B0T15DRAFT_509831 [Chaetomium strumarium]